METVTLSDSKVGLCGHTSNLMPFILRSEPRISGVISGAGNRHLENRPCLKKCRHLDRASRPPPLLRKKAVDASYQLLLASLVSTF